MSAIIDTPSPNFDERTLPVTMVVLHYTGMQDAASAIARLTDPVDGLLPRIIEDWMMMRRTPCVYSAEKTQNAGTLSAGLRGCGFEYALAHGASEIHGSEGSFFVFFHAARDPGSRDAYLLDLVMPHLHMALYRMLPNEHDAGVIEVSPENVLSSRELEVLGWVREGKTNQEIGQVLDISPLTVKNHVQKILRKLNVSNRAQAVARGQSAHLFGSQYSAARLLGQPLPD